MKKNLLKSLLLALMVLVGGNAWAGDKTVVKYSFDDAMSPSLTAGSRVSFDYDKTSVITSTTFLNAWNSTNGDPGASTVSLGSTDLSGETWTLSFEWAACGGCNSKADHTTLKAGDTNLFDLTGNSNWNTTVTITYNGSDGTKTLPVPGCDKGKRFTAGTGDQLNTTAYWHHIVVTGSASGVTMTITNSSTGTAVVENVMLSETNVNPTSLIIEPCCGGAIGIDELSLTYYVEGEVIQTPTANYTAVNGIERTITATCETEDATLNYSTDGENWTEGASVTVSESGNVYFKAVKGNSESDVLTFEAVAGEAITLNAPTIVRSDNTTVTISADQTNLLLSPDATIKYTYGNETGEFTGSKTLTVAADATITAYAEATGYTNSTTSERAVALFPEYVNSGLNTPTKTSGTSSFALSTETITVSEREYAALLLDDVQWGTNVYLQNLTITDPIVWGIRNGNWYINTTDPQWILIRNLKANDIVVVDVTYPAADMVNATYSEKLSFGTKHAYIVETDGDVELDLRKTNAKEMNYFYGVYSYSPMSEEEIAAITAFQDAKAALETAITEAKAIETEGKEGVEALQTAIATAEGALAAEDATTETLTAAKTALDEAVAAFEEANKPAFDLATAIVNAEFNPEADPLGWEKVNSAQYYDLGMGLIGTYQVRGEHSAATVDETHLATEFAAGLECRWQTSYAAFTQTTAELPAGYYKLSFDVENTNATTTQANYENRFFVKVGETTYNDESTEWMNGKSAWTTHTITFTLTEASPITISLGYGTGSNNFGVGNTPALFVSHLMLETSDPLVDSKEIALKAVDALPVGDGLFMYPEAAITTAKGAIESATTVDEVNAALAAAKAALNKPAADKAYAIANTTATGNLCITTEKVSVAKDASVFFTEVEGGYILSNEAGEYIFKTAGNTWTLSTTTTKEEAYVVNFNLADGAYTIQGANGLFGLDNTDEGSAVYANKAAANNGLWTIAEYVAPVKTDYTDYIVNADLTAAEIGWEAAGTKTSDYKEGAGIVKVGNAAEFDFKQTISIPSGYYRLTAQAAYRYGADEAAEAAAITEGTNTKLVKMYVKIGEKEFSVPVQNRYDGASETNLASEGAVLVNDKYVPNSSSAVQAWFAAGKYVNEVIFNLPADGDVTIGINRIATPESDYTVIGPWTLTRLGDAEAEPEPEPIEGIIYSWESPEGTPVEFGGTIAYVNGDGDRLNYKNGDYYTICLNGKKANIDDETASANAGKMVITLDEALNSGDTIVYTAYINKNTSATAAAYILFENGAEANGADFSDAANINEAFGGTPQNDTIIVSEAAAGSKTITLTRGKTGTNLFITKFQIIEKKAEPEPEPTPEPGTDMTAKIVNPSFETGNLDGWTVGNSADTGVKENSNATYATEGCDGNYLFNTWWQGIPITQTVKDLSNGLYELKALMTNDAITAGNQPCLYLLANGGHSEAFSSENAGKFAEGSIQFYVLDGTATIGAVGGNADGSFNADGYYWYKVDNFRLTYLAPLPNIDDVVIPEGKMSVTAANAITTAKEAGDVIALMTAVENAKASIEAYAHMKKVLDDMTTIAEATNVYTAEAKNAYDEAVAAAQKGYDEGTVSDADAAAFNYGSRLNGTIPTLLLSAWTAKATGIPYINTWSVEGNNDGTNFFTPFFEYWVTDENSLAADTLTATLSGLEAGDYDVTAWVRVRMKNGAEAPAFGITLQANDGEAIDVAAGDQVGTSQFYIKEFTATGTVAEDGVLKIKFNVAADNNISWLSFKNVKFEKHITVNPEDPDLIEIEQEQQDQEGGVVTLATVEKDEKTGVTTYTTKDQVCVIFKMKNVDVKDCDYILFKFAEPIPAGLSYAFWTNNKNKGLDEGLTEFKYVFAEDAESEIKDNVIPEISLLTIFGDAGKIVKVAGVYKHKVTSTGIETVKVAKKADVIYNLRGQKVTKAQKGLFIIGGKKVVK